MNMENQAIENRERGLHGVGGLLAVFVVLLMMLWPMVSLSSVARMFATLEESGSVLVSFEHYGTYRMLYAVQTSVCVAISFAAGYALWKIHRWSSVRWAIYALWSMFAIKLAGDVAIEMWFFSTFPDAFSTQEAANTVSKTLFMESFQHFIGGAVASGIWTAYLLRSRRVANTYRKELKSEAAGNGHRDLRGVGGWLALLVFSLMVLWPLASLTTSVHSLPTINGEYSIGIDLDQYGILKPIYWALIWGCAAASFSAGYALLKIHRQSSVRWAIQVLWGLPLVKVAADAAVELWFLYAFSDEFPEEIISQLFVDVVSRAAIYLAACLVINRIWTAYLLRSRRVENTYMEPVREVAMA